MGVRATADRRAARHDQTRDEIVQVAVRVMKETGAAGMSLGEVARRLGVRTPSLYVYFPAKAALLDEIFARGWRLLTAHDDTAVELASGTRLEDLLGHRLRMVLEWAHRHPGYAQLMFWRPMPNWEPSPEAYESAVRAVDRLREELARLQDAGLLAHDADLDEASAAWTVLVTGLVSQHLSNEPGVRLQDSRFVPLVAPLVGGFAATYGERNRR
jgi:AcrR family transcriptional regulator